MQEKAGEDASAVQPQQIQYTSLSSALQSSWATIDPRRSHKMICILQGNCWHLCVLVCLFINISTGPALAVRMIMLSARLRIWRLCLMYNVQVTMYFGRHAICMCLRNVVTVCYWSSECRSTVVCAAVLCTTMP